MNILIRHPSLSALLAGVVAVAGFAPLGVFPLPLLALAVLFRLWMQAESPRAAARIGFSFGFGLFSAGMGWIYIALHDYGYMPLPLALLATVLFIAIFAAFYALTGYLQARWSAPRWVRLGLVMPALWGAGELLRGYLFTGLPWLVLGYSQTPPSPLAGFAPLFGVYGVSLLLAVSAGLLALGWMEQGRLRMRAIVLLLGGWGLGAGLHQVAWTQPQGEAVKVSLLQGNISQDEKFADDRLVDTLETYRRLAQSSDARLIILPETALPLLREDVPQSFHALLRDHARQNGGDILIGAFEKENGLFFNSIYSLGSAGSQHYRKNHLVPFGEFIPLRSVFGWLVNEVLDIPMGDLASGGDRQPPLAVAGQQIAVNICYEDVFGEEIIRALPQATLLVNVTNDAWYGESHAAAQHNQLSQMRAQETGRMMLRATNTGVTSVIGADGFVQAALPQHEEGVLTAQVQGYSGSTPYVWWGNTAVMLMLIGMLGFGALRRNRIQVN